LLFDRTGFSHLSGIINIFNSSESLLTCSILQQSSVLTRVDSQQSHADIGSPSVLVYQVAELLLVEMMLDVRLGRFGTYDDTLYKFHSFP